MRFARLTEHHFAMFKASGCPPAVFQVYCLLIMHQNQPGDQVWPSIARMAEVTGQPRRTVDWQLAQLREAGLITAKRTRGPCIYTVRYATGGASSEDDTQPTAHDETRSATSCVPDAQPDVHTCATSGGSPTQPVAHGSRTGREKEERSEKRPENSPITGPSKATENPESVGSILAKAEAFQDHEPNLSDSDAKDLAVQDAERVQREALKAHRRKSNDSKEEARLANMRKHDPEKFRSYMADKVGKIGKMP